MKKPKITYDPEADALYIEFSEGKSAEQERLEIEGYIDYDKDGHILGVEILNIEGLMIAYHPKFRKMIKEGIKDCLRGNFVEWRELFEQLKTGKGVQIVHKRDNKRRDLRGS